VTTAETVTTSEGGPGFADASAHINPNRVLAVVAVAQFMVILDASIVNVALPTIKRDLGFSEQNLSWILNAYTLIFGGFLLLGGRLADRLGRRRLFMAGIALFSTASLICGISQSEGQLLVARGFQGLGGAMVSPAALSIILTTFAEGQARNRALAVWGAIAGAGGAVGLLLGGVLVQEISWRWVFTLIKAQSWGWTGGRTIGGLAVSVVLIAAFVVIERRHKDPLVPLRIFSNRTLSAANATFLLAAAALFAMFFFLTLYLQQVLGFSALKTGVAYLPLSLTIIAAAAVASRFVDRFTPKPVLVGGLLISTGGFVFLTGVSGHGDYGSHVVPAMVILGIGLGLAFVAVTIAGTTGVAPEDSGLASGLLNTTQQVGGSLGLAILSTVSTTRVTNALHEGAALPVALTHGFTAAFTVAGLLCGAGAVLAFVLLPRHKRAVENEQIETIALSFARCPGAPYCGHLARVVGLARRMRKAAARSSAQP